MGVCLEMRDLRVLAPVDRLMDIGVDQMTDIMQQTGGDHRRAGAGMLRLMGALQGMTQLGDVLFIEVGAAVHGEMIEDLIDGVHGISPISIPLGDTFAGAPGLADDGVDNASIEYCVVRFAEDRFQIVFET
jgi:hypothetical protein